MRKKVLSSLSTIFRLSFGFFVASQLALTTAYAEEKEDEGFSLRYNENSVRLGTLMQFNETYLIQTGSDNTDTFSAPRAQVRLSGSAVSEDFTYDLMFDLRDKALLKDASVNISYMKELQFKIGQFRLPFQHENLQLTKNLQFTERSLINGLGLERSLGASLHGEVGDMFEYAIFGANGDPDTTKKTFGARINLNILGNPKRVSDFSNSESLEMSFGSAFMMTSNDPFIGAYTGDLLLHFRGASLFAEAIVPIVKDSDAMLNLLVQAGYFILPKELELAVRYETLSGSPSDTSRISVAVNQYIHKKSLKGQFQYSKVLKESAAHDIQLQLQLAI